MIIQRLQPIQFSCMTDGFHALCISIFPALEPHPIPMFFNAPPNPAASCPLKWLRDIKMSASIIALPIFAAFMY